MVTTRPELNSVMVTPGSPGATATPEGLKRVIGPLKSIDTENVALSTLESMGMLNSLMVPLRVPFAAIIGTRFPFNCGLMRLKVRLASNGLRKKSWPPVW